MALLHRHQLARLSDAGWATVLARPWDAQARDCLAHWAAHRLPLVVTRQAAELLAADEVALGLPAPARWGRRRLALQLPRTAVLYFDEFPKLADVQHLWPSVARAALLALLAALVACRAPTRVYGSHGWQALSGLDHLRPESDLDLWVSVDDAAHADVVTRLLHAFTVPSLRLDGELVFDDGTAVAWREWAHWRGGRTRAVLTRGLTGVALLRDTEWREPTGLQALAA